MTGHEVGGFSAAGNVLFLDPGGGSVAGTTLQKLVELLQLDVCTSLHACYTLIIHFLK